MTVITPPAQSIRDRMEGSARADVHSRSHKHRDARRTRARLPHIFTLKREDLPVTVPIVQDRKAGFWIQIGNQKPRAEAGPLVG